MAFFCCPWRRKNHRKTSSRDVDGIGDPDGNGHTCGRNASASWLPIRTTTMTHDSTLCGLVPRYRMVERSQCRLLQACYDQDWDTVKARCESHPLEAFCKTSTNGRTALHLATMPGASCPPEIVQLLLETNPHAVLVQDRHRYGGTPLHFLCGSHQRNRVDLVNRFVQAATAPTTRPSSASSLPAQRMLQRGTISAAATSFRDLGTMPHDGWSPLYLAARRQAHPACLEILVGTRRNRHTLWIAPWTGCEQAHVKTTTTTTFKSVKRSMTSAATAATARCPMAKHDVGATPCVPLEARSHCSFWRFESSPLEALWESAKETLAAAATVEREALCKWADRLLVVVEKDRCGEHVSLFLSTDSKNDNGIAKNSSNGESVPLIPTDFKKDEKDHTNCDPVSFVPSDPKDDVNDEDNRLSPACEAWVSLLVLIREHLTISLVYTVANLYRPIPSLFEFVCDLFPEDVIQPHDGAWPLHALLRRTHLLQNHDKDNATAHPQDSLMARTSIDQMTRRLIHVYPASLWTAVDPSTKLPPALLAASLDASCPLLYTMIRASPEVVLKRQ